MAETAPEPQFPLPKILTYPASTPPTLISQGAEGRLYKTSYLTPDTVCALKHRPPKPYRHPVLDARLTRARILAEARVLTRCRRDGVPVPAVYAADEAAGWLMMEWIDGWTVRRAINDWLGARPLAVADDGGRDQTPLIVLMRRIGVAVGSLHKTGVIHGDLTTSNMMLRPGKSDGSDGANGNGGSHVLDADIVLIDFGLATQGRHEEDRAVDLYVLERAFSSTHPRAEDLFTHVLQAYRDTFKHGVTVLKKLEDVRMRGRKRSMIG